MTPKQFEKYLARDSYCLHCGADDDTLIPQHRANRGNGGSKLRDVTANIIVFCSFANGLAESDSQFAIKCRERGWKLHSWQDPAETPVYDTLTGLWWRLDNNYGRTVVE